MLPPSLLSLAHIIMYGTSYSLPSYYYHPIIIISTQLQYDIIYYYHHDDEDASPGRPSDYFYNFTKFLPSPNFYTSYEPDASCDVIGFCKLSIHGQPTVIAAAAQAQ